MSTISNKALAIIKNNNHLSPSILQNLLHTEGHYVPITQVAEILQAIKEHNSTHLVVSKSGLTVRLDDMDEVFQYAMAGGMPVTMFKQ